MIRFLIVSSLVAAAPAFAAERQVALGSFDRVRVSGPFAVQIAVGSPGARVEGDEAALGGVEVEEQGDTVYVRPNRTDAGASSGPRAAPAIVRLTGLALRSVAVAGGARVAAEQVGGDRVDLAVNGSGVLSVDAVDATDLSGVVIGAGSLTLAGKAARVRLLTNGPGSIDADALATDELTVRLDGPGETRARARFTARVVNTGAGSVAIAGDATCTVSTTAGGPVACGRTAAP